MICSFETCERPTYAKGYCNGHWQQLRYRGNDPRRLTEFRKPKKGKTCEVEGCDRPVEGRGMCQTHVKRFRATGQIVEIAELQKREEWGETCFVEPCTSEPFTKGFCRKHARAVRQYGLTREETCVLFREAKCSVCGETEPGRKDFHVDHDHACCDRPGSCGRCVRGLLCGNCNRALGNARDRPDLLRKLADYLEDGGRWISQP